jgi:hypothetical protein
LPLLWKKQEKTQGSAAIEGLGEKVIRSGVVEDLAVALSIVVKKKLNERGETETAVIVGKNDGIGVEVEIDVKGVQSLNLLRVKYIQQP